MATSMDEEKRVLLREAVVGHARSAAGSLLPPVGRGDSLLPDVLIDIVVMYWLPDQCDCMPNTHETRYLHRANCGDALKCRICNTIGATHGYALHHPLCPAADMLLCSTRGYCCDRQYYGRLCVSRGQHRYGAPIDTYAATGEYRLAELEAAREDATYRARGDAYHATGWDS